MICLLGKRPMGVKHLVFASHSVLGQGTEPMALCLPFAITRRRLCHDTWGLCSQPRWRASRRNWKQQGSTVRLISLVPRFGLWKESYCNGAESHLLVFAWRCTDEAAGIEERKEDTGWVWVSKPILRELTIYYWLITVTTTLSCIQLMLVTDLTRVW